MIIYGRMLISGLFIQINGIIFEAFIRHTLHEKGLFLYVWLRKSSCRYLVLFALCFYCV